MFRLVAIINQSAFPPFYIIVITWLLDLSYSFYRVTWRSQCNYTKSTVFVNNWSVRMFPTSIFLPSWRLNSICILAYIHAVTWILCNSEFTSEKIYRRSSFLGYIFNNSDYVNASEIARNMMYIYLLHKWACSTIALIKAFNLRRYDAMRKNWQFMQTN